MKSRCSILDCDYFDGGECRGFCTFKPVTPVRQQPTAVKVDLPIDVAEPDDEADWLLSKVIVAIIAWGLVAAYAFVMIAAYSLL